MENVILICVSGIALIICLITTFAIAYRVVNKTPNIAKQHRVQEGEMPIDDAIRFLRLTNLD